MSFVGRPPGVESHCQVLDHSVDRGLGRFGRHGVQDPRSGAGPALQFWMGSRVQSNRVSGTATISAPRPVGLACAGPSRPRASIRWNAGLYARCHPLNQKRPGIEIIRDIARMILFLASDQNLSCTGSDHSVDAGWTAGRRLSLQPGYSPEERRSAGRSAPALARSSFRQAELPPLSQCEVSSESRLFAGARAETTFER